MTPERYLLAMILFHTTTLGIACAVAARWWRTERGALPARQWIRSLAIDVGTASVVTYAVALLATTAVNLDYGRPVYVGEISGRLMGQALFGEAILLAVALALIHRRAGQSGEVGFRKVFGLADLSPSNSDAVRSRRSDCWS